ncbi:STAS domain-containing protein [Pseudonocardia sp. NPDC046786]|uniref:STAS domain-containing protein n=1 Tax=Pseudonocardia sp. NPDC046786 TaxID=3155471 RepID=UPI003402209C
MTDPRRPGPGDTDGAPGGTTRTDAPPQADGPEDVDPADGLEIGTTTPAEGVVVVTVSGELDMLTAPELRAAVADRIPSVELVVLALDGVRFLGTSGLAALIELREQAHRTGVELRIACTERRVLRPIGIAGLHHLFDIHDDVPAALNS